MHKYKIKYDDYNLEFYSKHLIHFSNFLIKLNRFNQFFEFRFCNLNKLFKKIAIIGMTLAGKTTFCKMHNGIDLDEVIILNTGKTISNLLLEGKFRDLETRFLRYIVNKNYPLISLGGGIILKKKNMQILKDYTIVFFDIDIAILRDRYRDNIRPLLINKDFIDKLYCQRYDLYIKYSDLIIKNDQVDQLSKILRYKYLRENKI